MPWIVLVNGEHRHGIRTRANGEEILASIRRLVYRMGVVSSTREPLPSLPGIIELTYIFRDDDYT